MKLSQQYLNLFATGFLIFIVTACKNQPHTVSYESEKSSVSDTINHGYNEVANPDNKKSITVSDFNMDNSKIKNIDRPNKSKIATNLNTSLLFGIWTSDPDGPHADFQLTDKSFYVVDYDGDGDMPYELIDRQLKIYYNDFIQEGKIITVDKDTLKIMWKDFGSTTNYVRWTQ